MKVNFNLKNIANVLEDVDEALWETADALKTDLIQSQTMPFATGNMQDDSMFVENKKSIRGVAKIVVDAPYSRKVYFDPEIHIKQGKNPNAKQYWFEDYITGSKKDLPIKYYKQFLKRRLR